MASCPTNSWQSDGETVETVTDFIFWSSKITADNDCSHEIKRHLLLGRKAMINLDSVLKSRDITLPTKVRLVKATVLPVVMYRCESWTIRKTEHQRIDAFELWCWIRLLRVPWTARTSNQSILKEISPGCSLEGLMLKLKLQYFGHLMRRADSFEKTLMLGKNEGRRRRGWQRMRWLDGITDSMNMGLGGLWELVIPSSRLILCCLLLLLPLIPHSIKVFSNESTLHMRWRKCWSFSFSIIPSKEIQGWSPSEWTGWISL